MRPSLRTLAACSVLVALSGHLAPIRAGGTGRVEGLLLGLDGRPAAGFRVHLIDAGGVESALAVAGPDGVYTLRDVAPGDYALAVESPAGQAAPVAAPPVRVRDGRLERRDIKLMQATPETRDDTASSNGGLGLWWAGLSTPAKIWVVVGSVVVVGLTYAAITDDEEQPASPSEP